MVEWLARNVINENHQYIIHAIYYIQCTCVHVYVPNKFVEGILINYYALRVWASFCTIIHNFIGFHDHHVFNCTHTYRHDMTA